MVEGDSAPAKMAPGLASNKTEASQTPRAETRVSKFKDSMPSVLCPARKRADSTGRQ